MQKTTRSAAGRPDRRALACAPPALAQQKIKIGFITTLSGPQGVIGEHMKDSVELALDHLGRKVGGLETEVIYGDDQVKPDVGVQVAEEMLKKHQVDFVSGIIWSNVMLAVVPVVTGAGKIMVGTNAGAQPARRQGSATSCYFSTSWKNDQTPEAMGKYMQDQGINDVYVMAPNYAGRQGHGHGLQALLQGPHRRRGLHQARAAGLPGRDHAAARRRTRRRCSSSTRAAWASSSSSSTSRRACAGRSRSTPCTRWTRSRSRRSRTPRSASTRRATGART